MSASPASSLPSAPETLLLIPVYNHAQTLRGVVERSLAEGYPVLVVDDGSTDGSLERVNDLPILLHRLPENRGKGARLSRDRGSTLRKGSRLGRAQNGSPDHQGGAALPEDRGRGELGQIMTGRIQQKGRQAALIRFFTGTGGYNPPSVPGFSSPGATRKNNRNMQYL